MDRKKEMLNRRLEGRAYQEIADEFNISRQRVQQILSPPKAIRDFVIKQAEGKCEACGLLVGRSGHIHHENGGDEDYNDIANLHLLCPSCHRNRHRDAETGAKISRGILRTMKRKYEGTGEL